MYTNWGLEGYSHTPLPLLPGWRCIHWRGSFAESPVKSSSEAALDREGWHDWLESPADPGQKPSFKKLLLNCLTDNMFKPFHSHRGLALLIFGHVPEDEHSFHRASQVSSYLCCFSSKRPNETVLEALPNPANFEPDQSANLALTCRNPFAIASIHQQAFWDRASVSFWWYKANSGLLEIAAWWEMSKHNFAFAQRCPSDSILILD